MRLTEAGMGQMPVPVGAAGTSPIRFSDQQVSSQADCAAKGGQLFDQQRLCCVRMNPTTGQPEPGRQVDYGWYCAQTTFGAPVPTPVPGMPLAPGTPYYPPVSSASILGNLPPWLPILVVVGGILFAVSQQRK